MSDQEKTLVDKIWIYIRNNKIAAIVIVMGVIIIGVASLKEALCTLDPNLPKICTSPTSTTTSLEGKVIYIHISHESQRHDAENLLTRLSDNGAKVYKVSNLVKEGIVKPNNEGLVFPIDNMQIKYFYTEDREAAQRIKSLAQRRKAILDPQTEASNKNPQGTIEVWYPFVVDQ